MKKTLAILAIFILATFTACDPKTGITITNKTDNTLYIEYTFNEIVQSENIFTLNNFDIPAGRGYRFISCAGFTIIKYLGFGEINSKGDAAKAMDEIFDSFKIYRKNGDELTPLYDKSFLLNTKNVKINRTRMGRGTHYTIEYTVK